MATLSPSLAPSFHELELPQDALLAIRKQAWELFEKQGLPSKNDEAFRYFPTRIFHERPFVLAQQAEAPNFQPHILPECQDNYLVFINGYFSPTLSRSPLSLFTLHDATRTYGHFLRSRLAKILKDETDPFALLNIALHPQGAFLYIPPKTDLGLLQILLISTEPKVSLPRLQVFAGGWAQAKIVVTNLGSEKKVIIPSFDFALEEGSRVQFHQAEEACFGSCSLTSLRATLKKSANFASLQWKSGQGITRSHSRVWLQGEEANAELKGIWMLKEKAQAHACVRIDHEAPHTQSMQLFKGVLGDNSQSTFEGKIYVRPEAQKTQAYQLNKNLLLSPHAIANVKPNLEIFADDVKASHGATVAHLDDELLFYLKTRGIPASEAKHLLIDGFCREILDEFITRKGMDALHCYSS